MSNQLNFGKCKDNQDKREVSNIISVIIHAYSKVFEEVEFWCFDVLFVGLANILQRRTVMGM